MRETLLWLGNFSLALDQLEYEKSQLIPESVGKYMANT